MEPPDARSRPATSRSTVDFPQPLLPTSAVISPGRALKLRRSNRGGAPGHPKDTSASRTDSDGAVAGTQPRYRDGSRCATGAERGYDSAMSIFNRIGNLAKGVWIQNTNPAVPDPVHESALERELAQASRAAARSERAPAAANPAPSLGSKAPAAPPEPSKPIELEPDGAVKRTL